MTDDDFDLVMATGSEKSRSELLLEQNDALKAQLVAVTKERDYWNNATMEEHRRYLECEDLKAAERKRQCAELSKTQAALDVMREGLEWSQCKSQFATIFIHNVDCPKCLALARADRILKGEI